MSTVASSVTSASEKVMLPAAQIVDRALMPGCGGLGPAGGRHAKADRAIGLAGQARGDGGAEIRLRARLGIGRTGVEPRASLVLARSAA